MTDYVLEFERPIIELEKRIQGMKELSENESVELSEEIERLEEKASKLREEIYSKLTRWQRVLWHGTHSVLTLVIMLNV